LSQQTADLQRRLEDFDLLAHGHPYSLRRASYRFLAANRQLCGRQQGAIGENRVAAFLGYPDHSVRPHCYVLHDARTGARDWQGKGAADILRADARAGSLTNEPENLTGANRGNVLCLSVSSVSSCSNSENHHVNPPNE